MKAKTSQPSPARDYLRQISQQLKPVAAMRGVTVNDILTEIYSAQTDCATWGTFAQWKAQGYRVQKGEQGFAVWSRPMKADTDDAQPGADDSTPGDTDAQPGDTDSTDASKREFFRVAYIFNARQVATREGITAEGADYAPTGYTPPHANHQPAPAEADAQPAPAEADAQPTPQPQPTPAPQPQPAPQPATAPQYIEQLSLAI